jgi:hypothetical protein
VGGRGAIDQVIVSASASAAFRVSEKAVGELSSLIVTVVLAPSVMTGASFTSSTVTLTVNVSVPPLLSEPVTVKLSVPK